MSAPALLRPGILGKKGKSAGGFVGKRSKSGFVPTQIAGMAFWLKADAGTLDSSDALITADGTATKTWQDQSGNAKHASQATAGKRPLFKTNIQNSKPGLKFDGIDDAFDIASLTLAQADTIIIVAKSLVVDANLHKLFDGATTRQLLQMDNSATPAWLYNAGSSVIGTAADANAHTFSMVFNGASSGLWLDGTSIAAGNPGTNTLTAMKIGTNSTDNGHYWNGYIFEIIGYSGALSTTNRQLLEAYAKSRWGTP